MCFIILHSPKEPKSDYKAKRVSSSDSPKETPELRAKMSKVMAHPLPQPAFWPKKRRIVDKGHLQHLYWTKGDTDQMSL